MRIEVLSDHVGAQHERLTSELDDNALRLAKHHERLEQATADLDAARRRRGPLRRLFRVHSAAERRAQRIVEELDDSIARARQRHQDLRKRRMQIAGGLEGEERFRSRLSRLSDEWTYLAGYQNRVGEVDAILIGPRSVWAVEVKFRRARLHVDGDEWWFEKHDRDGDVVETRPAVNGRGHNWGRQASDPARKLESWLGRNGFPLRVRTAVVLTNPQASLGGIRNQQVDLVTCDPFEVVHSRRFDGGELSETERDAIAELVRMDHRRHEERRSRRRAASGEAGETGGTRVGGV